MIHQLPNGQIHHARAEDVYPTIPDGAATLLISDGPYAMGIADWDRMKVADLPAFYRPHIAAWGRFMAPSASVYLWNTAGGWAAIHPEMLAAGWTFRGLIVWDKRTGASVISNQSASAWPEITEACGFYQKDKPYFANSERLTNVWQMASTAYADEKIRHETETLKAAHGLEWAAPLHPCQKPLLFAERMVRASSRPGDLVVAPFGGTCREAVAIERMAREEPAEARRYIVSEMDTDGKDYIGHAVAQIRGDELPGRRGGQLSLFGGGA